MFKRILVAYDGSGWASAWRKRSPPGWRACRWRSICRTMRLA
jgi:hypothetical protein